MRDEEHFHTVRFLTCLDCGRSYTASLSGEHACPDCHAPARDGDVLGNRVDPREEGDHVLLAINGPHFRLRELADLRRQIDAALAGTPESIAFRLDGITFLDSSMLAQLARTLKAMDLRDKPTYIITQDPGVVECLRMVDLDRLLIVLASEEEYRRELDRKPGA